MTTDPEFAALLERFKDGDEAALPELMEKYGHHVFRAVRRKLNRAIRSKFDSQDFVQAVWATFFEHRKRLGEFPTSQELVAFLSRIASNKVADESRRRLCSQGRNVNREVSLNGSPGEPQLTAGTPSPSAVYIAKEQWNHLVDGESDRYRQVIELKRAGSNYLQIADKLGMSSKTVQRVLKRLSEKVVP